LSFRTDFIGEESALAPKQQIPHAIRPRFGMTISAIIHTDPQPEKAPACIFIEIVDAKHRYNSGAGFLCSLEFVLSGRLKDQSLNRKVRKGFRKVRKGVRTIPILERGATE
jgi:hypothetical protein